MADFLRQVFQPEFSFQQTIQLVRQNRNFKSIYYQDSKYHEVFQGHINSLLASPAKRVHAFLLIQEYVLEMPTECLGETFKNWASFCVSYIEGSNWKNKNVALTLVDKLLSIGHDDDNTKRKLSLHVVSPLVEYICRNTFIVEKCDPSLVYKVLLTCITKYHGSCGSKKHLINTFISKNIHNCDNGFETLVSILANIHYCPNPGQSNATTKNSWFDHFCSVINTMNSILDRFVTWGVPFESLKLTDRQIPKVLSHVEKESPTGLMKLDRNYKALSLVASIMLADTVTVGISVPLTSVLQVISRASLVKLGTLYSKDPCLAITIMSIQLSSLHLLEKLISTLKNILIPHSKLMYQSLIGIMENVSLIHQQSSNNQQVTMSNGCFFDLKNKCYQVLNSWFTMTGPNMMVDKDSADALFKNFMADLKIDQKQLELRNIKKDKSVKISDVSLSIPFIKDKITSLHLNCLKACHSFIENCFIFLPSDKVTFFASFVLEEVLSIYKYSISSSLFYGKPETRRELLSLVVLLLQEDETISLGIGLSVLQKALTIDSSSLIRDLCLQSIRSLNGIVNPTRILRVCEATTANPFTYEDTAMGNVSSESGTQQNGLTQTNGDSPKTNLENGVSQEKQTDGDSNSNRKEITSDPKSNNESEIETDCEVREEDEDSEGFGIIGEHSVVRGEEMGDCILMETVKKSGGDDDLEIVSIKSPTSSFKRDNDVIITSPLKKTRIVQEDSQSSSRSLTIIEPVPTTTIVHEIIESSGEMNLDSDIIRDFVAD